MESGRKLGHSESGNLEKGTWGGRQFTEKETLYSFFWYQGNLKEGTFRSGTQTFKEGVLLCCCWYPQGQSSLFLYNKPPQSGLKQLFYITILQVRNLGRLSCIFFLTKEKSKYCPALLLSGGAGKESLPRSSKLLIDSSSCDYGSEVPTSLLAVIQLLLAFDAYCIPRFLLISIFKILCF